MANCDPQVSKFEAILRSPMSRTKKEVRSFLGLVGLVPPIHTRLCYDCSSINGLISKAGKNPVKWTEACESAFNTLKDKMCSELVLQRPDFNQRFLVQVDASDKGIGALLAQGSTGGRKTYGVPKQEAVAQGGQVLNHRKGTLITS